MSGAPVKHIFLSAFLSVVLLVPWPSQALDKGLTSSFAGPFIDEGPISKALLVDNKPEQAKTVETVLANPQRYSPAVLYPLARALFVMGRKDEAAIWFYSAQVRARFDARRTEDSSARQLVVIFNDHFGGPINIHAMQSPEKVRGLVKKAIDWDRKTPHEYDYRWMYSHGLGIMDKDTPGPDQWQALAETNRQHYEKSLEDALSKVDWKNRKSLVGTEAARFEQIVEDEEIAHDNREESPNSVYSKID